MTSLDPPLVLIKPVSHSTRHPSNLQTPASAHLPLPKICFGQLSTVPFLPTQILQVLWKPGWTLWLWKQCPEVNPACESPVPYAELLPRRCTSITPCLCFFLVVWHFQFVSGFSCKCSCFQGSIGSSISFEFLTTLVWIWHTGSSWHSHWIDFHYIRNNILWTFYNSPKQKSLLIF